MTRSANVIQSMLSFSDNNSKPKVWSDNEVEFDVRDEQCRRLHSLQLSCVFLIREFTFSEGCTTESPLFPPVSTTKIRGTPSIAGLAPFVSSNPILATWLIAAPVSVPP